MTDRTLVVTLASRTAEGSRAAAAAAAQDGGTLAEVRFDRWPPEELRRARRLFPSPIPLVATYRSVAEGGEGSVDAKVRRKVLEALRKLPFVAVDRERARDPVPGADELARSVGSRHLAAPVDWGGFAALAVAGSGDGERAKIVAPATISEFLGPLRSGADAVGPPRGVVLTTGPSGPLSRVWPDWLGTEWIFAAPGPSDPQPGTPVEVSQVPVDRLRSCFATVPEGPFFAVIGHPVAFSESPRLHHEWMRADGSPGAYVALDVETERELRDLLERLGSGGFRGVNVTHPWKHAARSVASRCEASAVDADAANCLSWEEGEWVGALTDVDAVERRLAELRREGAWDGSEFALLGAGAAARATVVAARRSGATCRVRARRPAEATALHRRYPETVTGTARLGASLVLHATSVGRGDELTLGFEIDDLLEEANLLLDFVYADPPSPLARRCADHQVAYEDGRRLLRYQAEASYRRWWGREPPAPDA